MITYQVVTGFLSLLFPGVEVILKDQNTKSPAIPYVAWKEIVNVSKSRPEAEYVDRSGQYTEKLTQSKVATIQIDIFTETISQSVLKGTKNYVQAGDLGDNAILKASTFNAQKYQRDNDFGVMDWTDPSRFAQFLGDNSEDRAIMEFKLNNTQVNEEAASAIDTATIDINLTLEQG